MKINRFEDMEVWQKARELVKSIYEITKNDLLKKDYGFTSQIQRASVSVMSNIAEGFERRLIKFQLKFKIEAPKFEIDKFK